MNPTIRIATVIAALSLSACGIKLEATRVPTTPAEGEVTKLTPVHIKGEGIVYALPRTELEIIQPIKLTLSTAGGLRNIYGDCRRACDANPEKSHDDECTIRTRLSELFAPPELRTNSVPDHTRLYQITPSADLFQSLNFKFEIASNGVVDKIDATASNTGFEVVSNIVSTLISLTMGQRGSAPIKAAGDVKSGCHSTSAAVVNLLKSNSGTLQCNLVEEIEKCLAPFEKKVAEAQQSIDDIFAQARSGTLEADLVMAIATHHRDRLAEATRRYDQEASLFGLGEGKDIEAVYQIILPMGAPEEFRHYANEISLNQSVTNGSARIVGMSDNAGSYLPILRKLLENNTRIYHLTTTMPDNFQQPVPLEEEKTLGKGYRYRVPVSAKTTLTVFGDLAKKTTVFGPTTNTRVIAQYGPIAALPSSFKGKGGHVLVKHWPDSGGLQTVEIGAEALPTSAVTDVIGTTAEQNTHRR